MALRRKWWRWTVLAAIMLGGTVPFGDAATPISEIRVNAAEFKFAPKMITLRVGRPVRIRLVNRGSIPHDLQSEGLGLHLPPVMAGMGEMSEMEHPTLAPGGTVSVVLTPRRKGTFAFACAVSGHKEAGMGGTIVVQ